MTESAQPPFEGVAITVGGRTLVLPPLSFGYLRKNADKLVGIRGAASYEETIDTMIEVAHASLARNYPSITIEEVAEMLDRNTSQVVFDAIKRASGFDPGEAQPGTETKSA